MICLLTRLLYCLVDIYFLSTETLLIIVMWLSDYRWGLDWYLDLLGTLTHKIVTALYKSLSDTD
jgi:hypothetical protein